MILILINLFTKMSLYIYEYTIFLARSIQLSSNSLIKKRWRCCSDCHGKTLCLLYMHMDFLFYVCFQYKNQWVFARPKSIYWGKSWRLVSKIRAKRIITYYRRHFAKHACSNALACKKKETGTTRSAAIFHCFSTFFIMFSLCFYALQFDNFWIKSNYEMIVH